MKTNNKKLGLFVAHNIFLNRDQRYKLADGETLELTAASLPVWIMQGTKTTSEPASEVFCKYVIHNNGENKQSIKYDDGKYSVWLPPCNNDHDPERPSNDEWRKLSREEKDAWYNDHKVSPCGLKLKDRKDRGSNGFLRFDQHKKINNKKGGVLTVVHCIQFKPVEELMKSLI